MIELRKSILLRLKTIHPRVAYQTIHDSVEAPYVIFDISDSFMNDDQEIFVLDIDVWDIGIDTTELEKISGRIWKQLHKFRHIDENIQFSVYRSNRLPPIEDGDLRRRRLVFELRYFDRRLNDGTDI